MHKYFSLFALDTCLPERKQTLVPLSLSPRFPRCHPHRLTYDD